MKIQLLNLTLTMYAMVGMNSFVNAQAPDWKWAKGMGTSPGDLNGFGVGVDASGNVYSSGSFEGTVDFDPGPGVFNLTSGGSLDIFVVKTDSLGNFIWARSFTGTNTSESFGLCLDSSANVYSTGFFAGAVDFDPGPATNNLNSGGPGAMFISKLDSGGNFIWAKKMVGITGSVCSFSIAIGSSGNVYTTGYLIDTVDFDPGIGTFYLNSKGMHDVFVSKLNSAGKFIWAKNMGGIGEDVARSIALDADENIYLTGTFQDTADFDPDTTAIYNLIAAGNFEVFISKLDSAGHFKYAKTIGNTWADEGRGIKPDKWGNAYITGNFDGTVDFDPGAGVYNLTAFGNYDIFVLKLNSIGEFDWARQLGGAQEDHGITITTDDSGNVFSTGVFIDVADFDPGAANFDLTSQGYWDIYISKLDSSGNFVWAKSIGGIDDDYGTAIVLDADNNLYLTGYYYSATVLVGNDTLTNADNTPQLIIARLDNKFSTTGISDYNHSSNLIQVYPNPANDLLVISYPSLSGKEVKVSISDITGKVIYTTASSNTQWLEVNTKNFAEGVYVVEVKTKDFVETRKLIRAK